MITKQSALLQEELLSQLSQQVRQTKDIFGKRVPDGYVGRDRGDIHIDIQTGSLNNVDDFIHYFTIMIYFLIGIQSCLFVSGKPFFNELQIQRLEKQCYRSQLVILRKTLLGYAVPAMVLETHLPGEGATEPEENKNGSN